MPPASGCTPASRSYWTPSIMPASEPLTHSAPQQDKPHATVPAPGRANTLQSSFRYAFAGLAYCFHSQRNFRIHISIAAAATLLGIILGLSWTEWAVLTSMIVLVLAAEMTNTMVESLVDLVTPDYHPLAKIAKDAAAGVVLLTAIGSVIVGIFIFLPKILAALRLT